MYTYGFLYINMLCKIRVRDLYLPCFSLSSGTVGVLDLEPPFFFCNRKYKDNLIQLACVITHYVILYCSKSLCFHGVLPSFIFKFLFNLEINNNFLNMSSSGASQVSTLTPTGALKYTELL